MIKGYDTYKQNNTMGMSQLELILTVYRGTIRLLKQAKADFEEEKYAEGRTSCDKARKCIVHLYTTLDMEKGEDIAEKLGQLYAFMIEQVDMAVASKSLDLIDTVIGLLSTIKEGWEGLNEQGIEKSTPAVRSNQPDSYSVSGPIKKMAEEKTTMKPGLTISA
ncbi:MAG: flagellar export chaperone FliS [candidate division Zixibacteria bacterium]|nr:flagellar export chaperone FliS [candidate division Zixibacteria bacterium]